MSLTTTVTDRAAEFLGKRTSRRGFLSRTALVGSAVTTAGVTYATRPTSAYAAVCGCNGRTCDCTALCCDGYTEFCCQIYGSNSCPPNTILAGWWKVDNSDFCSGAARYYMDCNKASPGCACGSSGVCRDGTACQCRSCGNRKDGCTVFRYGNCNNHVSCVGPIMCRVVTCSKPWEIDPGCSTTARTDNNTRWHHRPCLEESSKPDSIDVFASANNGDLWQKFWRAGSGWSRWVSHGGHVVGGVSAIARNDRKIEVFGVGGRGGDRLVRRNWTSGRWTTWRDMGHPRGVGLARHAPAVCFRQGGNAIDVFAAGADGRLWQRYWRAGAGWSGWVSLGGHVVGGVSAIARNDRTIDVFAVGGRGGDRLVRRSWSSGRWSSWRDMGHPPRVGLTHAPGVCFRQNGNAIDVFAAGEDGDLWQRYWRAGDWWSGWVNHGGNVVGGVSAIARDDQTIDVFAIGGRGGNRLVRKYWNLGRWSGWRDMGHPPSVGLSPHGPGACFR